MLSGSLAALGFVAPWLAWGAIAAAGLPIVAHLLSKTRYREVVFPAARLVQRAVASTSRIETPRHRLLLLLRCLALLLLVLAFMRPQWTPDATAGSTDRGIALVLMIDASASMQRTDNGATLYDRALRQAEQFIEQLDPRRDVAAVYRIDHAPKPLLPEITAQFSLLVDRLSATRPGYTHADWAAALADLQRLTAEETRAIHLVTISDQQGDQPDLRFIRDAHPELHTEHHRIAGPTDNTAIRLIDVRPYPPVKGQPITVVAEVKHFGDQTVSTTLAGRFQSTQMSQALELPPGSSQRIALQLPVPSSDAGLLQLTLTKPDAIPADNTAGVWLDIYQQPRVLIVHGPNRVSENLAKRLQTLVNPGKLPGRAEPTILLTPLDRAGVVLEDADPADFRTIILIHEQPLPDPLSAQLNAYAQAGGGIVELVAADDASTHTTTASNIDFDLEPLRVFEGPSRAGLSAMTWPGVSNRAIDPRAKPILKDDFDRVIVAEMLRGRGRLIAINASLSEAEGGLLAEPMFVVLFNELCRYASPGSALPPTPHPGDVMPLALRDAEQRQVPQGVDDDATSFTSPGPYAALSSRGAVQEMVYVALFPDESDTQAAGAWSGVVGPTQTSDLRSDPTTPALIRNSPIELWPYFMLAVMGLIGSESLLLWRFSRPIKPIGQGGVA